MGYFRNLTKENSSQNSFALAAGNDLEKCSLELHGSRRHLPGGDVSVLGPGGMGSVVEALAADVKIVFNRGALFDLLNSIKCFLKPEIYKDSVLL